MATSRIGRLKPVYTLLLNPHAQVKLSRCPRCRGLTYPRKFALLIHAEGHGLYAQGKTCKYCPRCRIIMVQQDELEAQLAHAAIQHFPAALGRQYTIIGIVQTNTFKKGLEGATPNDKLLDNTSDLREQIGLSYSPGGWYPEGRRPPVLPPYRPQRIPTTLPQHFGGDSV